MGTSNTKIEDSQRIKTYRRVTLIEAKEQFAKVTNGAQLNTDHPLYLALNSFPVSVNFHAYFGDTISNQVRMHFISSDGVEMDGKLASQTVYHLLQTSYVYPNDLNNIYKVVTVPVDIPKDYCIGLFKAQYDALYPTAAPTTQTTPAS